MAIDLNIEPLEKALVTLDVALEEHSKRPNDTFVRDACIQRFEYSYELSFKSLRRFLEVTEPSQPDPDFASIIRLGYARGLLASELAVWRNFREKRNITSHSYDEEKAREVLSVLPAFLQEARSLLREMQQRITAA